MEDTRVEEICAHGQDFEERMKGRRKDRPRVAKEYIKCLNILAN